MKKSLVALAALSAISAFADVDVSGGIKMYGVLDQAYLTQSVTRASTAAQSFSNSGFFAAGATSRLGFKGERDLGEGLKGFLQAEIQLDADQAQLLPNKNRGTFVGLTKKEIGSVRLGTQETLAYMLFGMDVNGRVEYKPQVWRFTASADQQDRMNNSVRFTTEKFQGFSADFMMGSSEVTQGPSTTSSNNGDFKSIGINYDDHGALTAKFVMDTLTNTAGAYALPGEGNAGVLNKDATGYSSSLQKKTTYAAADQSNPLTRQMIGVSYKMEAATLNWIYASSAVSGTGSLTTNTVGVRVPMDKITLAASVGSGTYSNSAATIAGSVNDLTVGGYYNFDKSTSAYLLTSRGKNVVSAAGTADANHTAGTTGASTSTAIGVQYKF